MPFEEGPYVQMAGFCEQVIEDKTGVLSLIRVIDTVTQTAAGPAPPEEMPPVTHRMKLVLMLKSGHAVGRHEIQIIPQLPSGETERSITMSIHLEGEEKGANIIADMNYTFKLEGPYWFNVYFDGELLTKVPFRVKYSRIITGPPPPSR